MPAEFSIKVITFIHICSSESHNCTELAPCGFSFFFQYVIVAEINPYHVRIQFEIFLGERVSTLSLYIFQTNYITSHLI